MRLNRANLQKTIYYFRRNGLKDTLVAVRERLADGKVPYVTHTITSEEREAQRKGIPGFDRLISVVVPAYKTNPTYLRELLDSMLAQTYSNWELILADASPDDEVKRVVDESNMDSRIIYVRLSHNGGISENTNQALEHAHGDYIGLLDHDDLLTEDALYEVASAIAENEKNGIPAMALYSDEDKCDGEGKNFYEPNIKEKFNLDLLFSNNYICHFWVMEANLMKKLGFRKEFDGAQDYDLILRTAEECMDTPERIVYINKVLYHWRCHSESTAENPASKTYAYEAGRRALQDMADRLHIPAEAVHLKHLGFYRLDYKVPILEARSDLAAVGGRVLQNGRIAGGRFSDAGILFYENLPASFGGYLHRAKLTQDADALDIRCIKLKETYYDLFHEITGVTYQESTITGFFDDNLLPKGTDAKALSLQLGRAIRERGGRILYLPDLERKLK